TADLPEAWNTKFREYFGIDVPNDAQGVLQDVHWSQGSLGYFPTYALGNVLASMLCKRMNAEIPSHEQHLSAGDLSGLRAWLVDNTAQPVSFSLPMDLVEKILGARQLDAKPLIAYLTQKDHELCG